MLPALGRDDDLGNIRGRITVDTSDAEQAAQSMRKVGRQIEEAMGPAERALAAIDAQLAELRAASQRPINIGQAVAPNFGPAQREMDAFITSWRRNQNLATRFGDTMRGVGNTMRDSLRGGIESLNRVEARLSGLRSNLLPLTIALGTLTVATRRAFRALEEGAELELTQQRFNRLAESIGSTGVALRTDIQGATEGMLSSMESMTLATDLLALNMVETHDEAVRMARVVSELNIDMNELTLTIANKGTRRFDQMGIALVGFKERLREATEEVGDAERAFTLAFLAQAEAQIERVGGVSQTTAGDLRRMKADWAALNETAQEALATWAGPFLEIASGRAAAALRKQATEAVLAADSIDDLAESYKELREERERLRAIDPIAFRLFVEEDANLATAEYLQALANMTESSEEFERTAVRIFGPSGFTQALIASGARNAEAFYEQARAIRATEGADRVLIQSHQQLVAATEAAAAASSDFFNLLDSRVQSFRNAANEINRYTAELERMAEAERSALRRQAGGVAGAAARAQEAGGAPFASRIELDESTQLRTDAILEWAREVQSIEEAANAQRISEVNSYQQARSRVIQAWEQQRLFEEQDFLRQRARQNKQLEDDIQDIRDERARQEAEWWADLQDRIGDAREQAQRDLERLEEDHGERMEDIRQRFNTSIQQAAGELDATTVHRLQQQRKEALEQEQEDYEDSRDEIEERLEEFIAREEEAYERRVQLAREADERRIQNMRDAIAERQRIEDEERAIRLERDRQQHLAQLEEMRLAHEARMGQIDQQAANEQQAYEDSFLERLDALGIHHEDWLAEQEQFQEDALEAFEEWWEEMQEIIEEEAERRNRARGPGGVDPLIDARTYPQGQFPQPVNRQTNQVSATFAEGAIQVNAAEGQSEATIAERVIGEADNLLIEVLRSFA